MSESLFYALTLILALAGLYYLFESLYCRFLCERNTDGIYTVIFHSENESTLPDKVYTAMVLSRCNAPGKRQIFVVDNGFSRHIKLRCQLITGSLGTVHFIKREDLKSLYKINSADD